MAFDFYYKWLGIPPAEQPPNHYRLLSLALFESDRDVIDAAANRQMSYVRRFVNSEHAEHSSALLTELSKARLCLLNHSQKSEYDGELRRLLASQPAPPLQQSPSPAQSRIPQSPSSDRLALAPETLEVEIKSAFSASNWGRVIELSNGLIQRDPNRSSRYVVRAEAYRRLGQHQMALKDLSQAVRLDVSVIDYYLKRAGDLKGSGRFAEAISECSIVIDLVPGNLEAYEIRMFCYRAIGNIAGALSDQSFLESLDVTPGREPLPPSVSGGQSPFSDVLPARFVDQDEESAGNPYRSRRAKKTRVNRDVVSDSEAGEVLGRDSRYKAEVITENVESQNVIPRLKYRRKKDYSGLWRLAGLAIAGFVGISILANPYNSTNSTNTVVELRTPEMLETDRVSKEKSARQLWLYNTQALPPQNQIAEVAKKLVELNPGFDGNINPKIVDGKVYEVSVVDDHITNLFPVRVFKDLTSLVINGTGVDWDKAQGTGKLSDIQDLEGMQLTKLDLKNNPIADISVVRSMPLTHLELAFSKHITDLSVLQGKRLTNLHCRGTRISDLSPLRGMPLTQLNIDNNKMIADLEPLTGMKLNNLWCQGTKISSVAPLKGMPLQYLGFIRTQVHDLTPLKGMPLILLSIYSTPVTNLEPLEGMRLEELSFSPGRITNGLSVIRNMPTLTRINDGGPSLSPSVFWMRYDAGEFREKN